MCISDVDHHLVVAKAFSQPNLTQSDRINLCCDVETELDALLDFTILKITVARPALECIIDLPFILQQLASS